LSVEKSDIELYSEKAIYVSFVTLLFFEMWKDILFFSSRRAVKVYSVLFNILIKILFERRLSKNIDIVKHNHHYIFDLEMKAVILLFCIIEYYSGKPTQNYSKRLLNSLKMFRQKAWRSCIKVSTLLSLL
jgi:hypothetical protein